ncbi:E3 ubiquitin-protein ligase PUB23-like [Panicum miliaceum]|uniref:U-box domain-containing protein n=1 Tax=Panicum miliaceum TaxID=4540 RepID=A0A3L6R9E6_PANMI|nr:E3 ubiquitin-protein ligase PUB23-like [Panicum miliaceum]
MEDMGGSMRHHLMCPISLQPMQDPVTAPTGITYDRRAIERWLAAGHATCPVTGQPLALADLTPNHTLRRLIQSWRQTSSTPVGVGHRPDDVAANVAKKLLAMASCPPVDVLREAAEVAAQNDVARRNMVDAGVLQRVLRLAVSRAKAKSCHGDNKEVSLDDMATVTACLSLVRALAISGDELRPLVADNHVHELVDAVTDVLVAALVPGPSGDAARASAVQLLDAVTEACGAQVLERLRPELFRAVTAVVRDRLSPSATRSALRALLHACPVGRNRALIVEAGAAHEAIELELDAPPPPAAGGRRATELAMALLAELCACADGRAAVAAHPAGVAVVARRLLRVSAAADACVVRVLAAVGGRAASPEVLREMARVGAVGKLCCALQADCDAAVKEAARAVLRLHSGVWSGSPCVSAYLLSRYL